MIALHSTLFSAYSNSCRRYAGLIHTIIAPILAVAKGKKRNAGEEKIYHRGKETILDKNKYAQEIKIAQKAINKLLIQKKDYAYCQPCFSPVWDSGWMGIVNIENGILDDRLAEWFLKKEIKIFLSLLIR